MVANDDNRSTSIGSDDDMHMTSHDDVVMNGHTIIAAEDLMCPHCDYRCSSQTSMTQHSWEQHPLLMRRKKHLITSAKVEPHTAMTADETMLASDSSRAERNAPPVQHTLQHIESCQSPKGALMRIEQKNDSQPRASMEYRNNAMRSLSLLSTAAAIVEQQSQPTTHHRHVAVVRPQPVETQQSSRCYPSYPDHPIYAPVYNAFIPGLNQYVTIPIQMAPNVPNPTILNPSIENTMNGYLHTQTPRNTQFSQPIQLLPPKAPTQPTVLAKSPESTRQTSDEIRTLLQTKTFNRKMAPQSQPSTRPPCAKISQNTESTSSAKMQPILEKDRLEALEKAILSMDCCDINDTSTKMPFKCADGVWRMVSFKCIKGLWVVQTPESATPTVYVPCDGDKIALGSDGQLRRGGRSLSEGSGHKRKHSHGIRYEIPVEAKRLCASAPVPTLKSENPPKEKGTTLKRTQSNPFITKSLPKPSQHFTNNEGKRVNISMIKRNDAAQSSSCSLIKSLLLRKPAQSKSTVTSHAHTMTSQPRNKELQCKSASGNQLASTLNPRALSDSSMAY